MSTHALQVYLDREDFNALRDWARARGWTLSHAVRVALKAVTRPPPPQDPLLAASGMIEGLPRDLSAYSDEYLNLSFVAEPAGRHTYDTKKRRPKKTAR
ncbi:MAG: hypothetical protein HY953_02705 [Candidatus Rokubacteria bacterium]|nr:hypothetical protein [Candidatus Rokubacteria bacterium]